MGGKKKGCHLEDRGILDVDRGETSLRLQTKTWGKRTVLCLTVQMTGSLSLEEGEHDWQNEAHQSWTLKVIRISGRQI